MFCYIRFAVLNWPFTVLTQLETKHTPGEKATLLVECLKVVVGAFQPVDANDMVLIDNQMALRGYRQSASRPIVTLRRKGR